MFGLCSVLVYMNGLVFLYSLMSVVLIKECFAVVFSLVLFLGGKERSTRGE